ncbi:hypothetical protein FQN54_008023 [Arachnomyces sp. PD_36]|nr:hypothetical protein FQN54_008023 [Arachnomyces sp. PD_36]
MFSLYLIALCTLLANVALGGVLGHDNESRAQPMRRAAASDLPVRIITHNIRYAADPPSEGEQPWTERKRPIVNELLYLTRNQESFLCLQEVLHNQLTDVLSGLNPSDTAAGEEWDYIGVGRDDGHQEGEYAPIFYRPATWELHDFQTVWLSETPNVPSKGWDAASIRIVTIGVFEHRETGKKVLALNTHLDDQGQQARLEGAKIILDQIADYLSEEDSNAETPYSAVFLAGDFNSEEDGAAYQTLTASNSTIADPQKIVPPEEQYGEKNTSTGFGDDDPSRIDYILLGPSDTGAVEQTWTVEGYSVQPNQFEDGVYISDHRAVVVDAVFA